MNREAVRTVIKLLIASLIVGLVMAMIDVTPLGLIQNLGENVEKMFNAAVDAVSWGIGYVLMGAIVVVPIWLIFRLLGAKSKRST